jgi:hypothetical protein
MRSLRFRTILALLGMALVVTGCGKNPVESRGDVVCDHVDADGVRIEHRGVLRIEQWQATVTGEVAIAAGQSLDTVLVRFLAPDSTVLAGDRLACGDKTLAWEVADTTVLAVAPGPDPWSVRLVGRVAGSTTVRFRVVHVDHADFTSLPLPIRVVGASPHVPVGATAALLFQGCSRVASHGYAVPGAYGRIVVARGSPSEPIGVQFLNANGAVVSPDESGYALAWSFSTPGVVQADTVAGRPYHLRLEGLAAGRTTLTVRLVWNGGVELTMGPFDVTVVDPLVAGPMRANFLLKRSGVRQVFVRQDTLVASCGATPAVGSLSVPLDTLTDLIAFRLVNFSNCAETLPSNSFYALAFEFEEPCIAGIVAHPEHIGEYFDFHLRGLSPGETTLRIHYFYLGVRQFTSPPIPVRVAAPTGPVAAVHE